MATTVVVNNQPFKRRHPLAVWIGLPLITLGIYYFVWWYKVNNEARRFLNDRSINPALSVAAVTLGSLIIVPPFVSAYGTTQRIARMQERAGMPAGTRANPWIAVLLHFIFGAHALYMQLELNRIWDGYAHPGMTPLLPPPAPPPAPPPV
jgi:drug/metabolite transporter (DMT)-like permease